MVMIMVKNLNLYHIVAF